MTPLDQNQLEKLKKSIKYQLMHKFASMMTKQQMEEKAQQTIAQQKHANMVHEKEHAAHPESDTSQ